MKEKRSFLCSSVVYRQTWISLAYNVTVFCLYCSWFWIICYFHSSPLQQWFVKTHTGFHCYVCFQATASYLYLGFREQVRGTLSDPVSLYGVVDLIIYPFLMASLTTQSVHQSVFFSATSQEFQSIWKALGLATRCYFQRNCDIFFFSWRNTESSCRKNEVMTNAWIVRFFFLVQTVSPIQDANAHILVFWKDSAILVQTHGNCFWLTSQPLCEHGELQEWVSEWQRSKMDTHM